MSFRHEHGAADLVRAHPAAAQYLVVGDDARIYSFRAATVEIFDLQSTSRFQAGNNYRSSPVRLAMKASGTASV